ncbi:hypothetical protein AB0G67_04260 [Streptomyces sp. NPDC021056]
MTRRPPGQRPTIKDVGEMGRLMARLLFDRPSDLPTVVVPTRLVLRASA